MAGRPAEELRQVQAAIGERETRLTATSVRVEQLVEQLSQTKPAGSRPTPPELTGAEQRSEDAGAPRRPGRGRPGRR